MKILIMNTGSSSIKYKFVDMKNNNGHGTVDIIGKKAGQISHNNKCNRYESNLGIIHHFDVLKKIHSLFKQINVIGHRVVHGGNMLMHTMEINEEVKNKIKSVIHIAPIHNPANIIGIEISEKIFTGIRNLASYDTAFHLSIPEKAHRYAMNTLPYQKHNVRLYGFHGISHQYVSKRYLKYLKNIHTNKLITIHLGHGASMSAIQNGVSIDTTMGFGPNSGLIMGTRSGDHDTTIIFNIIIVGYSFDEIIEIVNKTSGMLSIYCSSDMRYLIINYLLGDKKAKMTYDMYYYRLKKYIGAFTSVMNGIDALIYTGGIGVNDFITRKLVCSKIPFLGIIVDEKHNIYYHHYSIQPIQRKDSLVKILVITTNEELEIYEDIIKV